MNKEIINIYRKNTSNTGDHYTTPTKYFDFLKNIPTLDIDELPLEEFIKAVGDKIIILGGGGLIEQDYFKEYTEALYKAKTKMLIGWSVGHNVHGSCDVVYDKEKYNESFDLLGVRDSVNDFAWVPCPSCMHPIFDNKFSVKNKIVIYEHKNFPMKGISGSFSKLTNKATFDEIVEFLASAEIVVTNSYHGAYWATLLKKKVLILQPFSSKFFGFKHPLIVINNIDDIDSINEIPVYPQALKEAREANLRFSEKVQKIIG